MATTTERALAELVARRAGDLVVAKNLVAEAKQEEARLGKQAEVASRAADEWGQRAMSAVRAGDDVIARDALVRRREYERQAEEFRAAIVAQRAEVLRLTVALSDQSLHLEEIKQRKNGLLLRAKRAGAEAAIDAVV